MAPEIPTYKLLRLSPQHPRYLINNSGSVPGLGLSPISPTKQPSRISPPSSLDSGSTGSCPCTQYHTMPEDNTRRDMRTSRDFLVFVYINLLNTVLIFLHLSLDFSQGCTTGLITETLLLFYAVKCVVFVTLLFRLIAIAIYSSFERTQNKASLKVESQVLEVRGRLIQDDRYPFARGANSHIYKGRIILPEGSERRVALKMIFSNHTGESNEVQLKREAEIWAPLNHKNVVPFLGMAHGIGGPILVSPLYELGHIGMFLAKRPEVVNRAGILLGVAAGLEYLHAHKIVHGDLKLQNVLVDESGTPFICDFGISKIINQHGFTTVGVGTLPYMAPELLIPFDLGILKQQPSTTTATDVYSFGILALEILTSEPPKRGSVRFFMSAKDIGPDLSPKRVDYGHSVITDEIWSVLEPCWAFEPQSRPAISEVRVQLMLTFA